MKKSLALLLALCMLLASIPVLAEENAAGSTSESAAGTWYLVVFGLTAGTFNLIEDGTFAMEVSANSVEKKMEGTWTQDQDQITLTIDGKPAVLVLDGSSLTFDPANLVTIGLDQTTMAVPGTDLSMIAGLIRISREPGKLTMAELTAYQEAGTLPEGKTQEEMDAIQQEMMIALMTLLGSTGGTTEETAGPELTVVEDNFYVREEYGTQEGVYFAKVQNDNDSVVYLSSGSLVLMDADKNVIGQTEFLEITGSCYLEPGEATFISLSADLAEGTVADSYTVHLTTTLRPYETDTILPVTAAELRVKKEYGPAYYAAATLTNPTDKPMAFISVVMAVKDSAGKLIALTVNGLYQNELAAGSSVTLINSLSDSAVEYCTDNGTTPAQVEAFAWVSVI
ncbi:MAG: hypothetical protein E7325_02710 [Clostridiales bacterium]|nr:hypothetical protein [Clostridiales bacterium]